MNVLFSIIAISSFAIALIVSPESALKTLLNGAESGVNFIVKLFIIYAVWLGTFKILEKCNVDKSLAKYMTPLTSKLFPNENEETYKALNLNLSANMLGIGGASTPMGIKACEGMRSKKNQIMLVVINSTSIQIIPTTIIAMRSDMNSSVDIILPCIIATVVTTLIGVTLVKVLVR